MLREYIFPLLRSTQISQKNICGSPCLINLHTVKPAALSERIRHSRFPVNFVKFFRIFVLQNISTTPDFNSTFLLFLDYLVCLKTNQYQLNSPGYFSLLSLLDFEHFNSAQT